MKRVLAVIPPLMFLLFTAGCANQPGLRTTPCDSSGAAHLTTVNLPASVEPQVVRFQPPAEGITCIQLVQIESTGNVHDRLAATGITDTSISILLGADEALDAFNGGGLSTQLDFGPDDWDGRPIALRKAADGRAESLGIINPGHAFRLDIFHDDRPGGPGFDFDVPEIDTVTLPEVDCHGRLRGFRPIDEYGSSTSLYPPMLRKTVGVRCTATWVNVIGQNWTQTIKVTTGFTYTDENGEYAFKIPGGEYPVVKSRNPLRLITVTPFCLIPEQCGFEAHTSPEQSLVGVEIDAVPQDIEVDIVDVLDIASQGPAMRNSDGSFGPRFMLGARLISRATTFPERNDRPFIIHEQVDVFNEEYSNFALWGFAGQPVRTSYTASNGDTKSIDPRTKPCDFVPENQLCVGFTSECNPNTCNAPDRACLEYPMMQALLDAGYDVWLIDHLRGQEDLTHIAAAAPLMYQRILNYGGPEGRFPVSPSMDETQLATFVHRPTIPTARMAQAELERLGLLARPPIAPPVPISGERRAIVSGYSLGGVISRIGLRLWEISASLPDNDLFDARGNAVVLAQDARVFMEVPGEKIALYVSLDAPHKGATTPVTLQAYAKRLGAVVDSLDELSEADREQANRVNFELEATPTRQTLIQEVTNNTTAELGCWHLGGGDPDASGCRVQPWTDNIQDRVDGQFSADFRHRWLNTVSSREPVSSDGLPATIPSVTVSNGQRGGPREVPYAGIIDLNFDINNYFDFSHLMCDEFRPDSHQGFDVAGIRLCGLPAHQEAGSQWNNVCRRISNVAVSKSVPAEFFPNILQGLYVWAIGVELRGIHVSYPMQPEFESDGSTKPGTGFPTLIPTHSSLLARNGRLSPRWRDAHWQNQSEYHTNIDNQICRMVLWHADGAFEDDKDGWPACGDNINIPLCRDGGRFPGRILGGQALDPMRAPCDCQPDDPTSHPGANERFGDGIDNNCNGQIDEAVIFQ